MKTLSKLNFLLLQVIFITSVLSCSLQAPNNSVTIQTLTNSGNVDLSITSWNLQTFFDGETSGNEYSQFIKAKNWGNEAYVLRIQRLCSVIRQLDSDVFVMEEIENENVLYDIYNFLAGEWNSKKVYNYAAFATNSGSSIGIGIVSRYPLQNLTVHSLELQTIKNQPSMRPLVSVEVLVKNKTIAVFMNHWKSMSGGKEESEVWRNWQESVLAKEIGIREDCGMPWIAAGDFNRDLNDFYFVEPEQNVVLREINNGIQGENGVVVKNPWLSDIGEIVEPGSYYYQGEWSRIDHFFYGSNVQMIKFVPEIKGEWCDDQTMIPIGYKIYNGSGYSDHLPISCRIIF